VVDAGKRGVLARLSSGCGITEPHVAISTSPVDAVAAKRSAPGNGFVRELQLSTYGASPRSGSEGRFAWARHCDGQLFVSKLSGRARFFSPTWG
jgi:hypothetical protein